MKENPDMKMLIDNRWRQSNVISSLAHYLFCQTDTFLFVIETPMRKCKILLAGAPAKRRTLKLKNITEHRNKLTSTTKTQI
jgi:hypothetical protein